MRCLLRRHKGPAPPFRVGSQKPEFQLTFFGLPCPRVRSNCSFEVKGKGIVCCSFSILYFWTLWLMTRLLIFNFKGKSKNFWNVSPYLWPNWNTSPSPGAWSKLFTENKFSPPQERTLGQPVQCWSIAKNSSFLNHSRPWLEYGLSSPIHGWLQLPLGRVSELGSVFRGLKEKVLETHSEQFFWGGCLK